MEKQIVNPSEIKLRISLSGPEGNGSYLINLIKINVLHGVWTFNQDDYIKIITTWSVIGELTYEDLLAYAMDNFSDYLEFVD